MQCTTYERATASWILCGTVLLVLWLRSWNAAQTFGRVTMTTEISQNWCNNNVLCEFSGHVTIFSWMLNFACCFVAGLWLVLDLVSGWLVVMLLPLYCHSQTPKHKRKTSVTNETQWTPGFDYIRGWTRRWFHATEAPPAGRVSKVRNVTAVDTEAHLEHPGRET